MDICRLFSAHLHNVCDRILPSILLDSVILASPAWMALNATDPDLKQFFRTAIAMDLRQAGDRVATKSVLWSYTALRHFAISHNVHICEKGGLHSITLLPYISQLQAHLATLESLPTPTFSNPPTMGPATSGWSLIEKHCKMRLRKMKPESIPPWWDQWSEKIKLGYERLVTTLWNIANEYHVDGYGLVLREKLEKKWCDCGCSTDHLGEVCERTVREEEEESKRRAGKEREWDGRGNGVEGWGTPKEEDIWEVNLEFGGWEERQEPYKNVSELVQWRYFKAEKEKEKVRRGEGMVVLIVAENTE
ncbi:hypothetical protein FRC02_008238 [Tulasnella sp. 418]|nr:hypothetical protein FRC02_008238 [Tulasnella sp. 418]